MLRNVTTAAPVPRAGTLKPAERQVARYHYSDQKKDGSWLERHR
jgi:hypothetical protein